MRELLQDEKERHKKAFETYYAMGSKRSYRALARQLDVSVGTVKLWGRSFDWAGRIAQREADAARRMADRSLSSQMDQDEQILKFLKFAIVKLCKAIIEGRVKMQMGDLDRLLRLQELYRSRHAPSSPKEKAKALLDEFQKTIVGMDDKDLAEVERELEEQER